MEIFPIVIFIVDKNVDTINITVYSKANGMTVSVAPINIRIGLIKTIKKIAKIIANIIEV